MALVHPDTAKLGPDEQKKGVYIFTPFEVSAYLRGEVLSSEDLAIVEQYYREKAEPMPNVSFKDNVSGCLRSADDAALTDQTPVCWACIEKDDRFSHTCKPETVRPAVAPAAFAAPYGQAKPTGKLIRKKEVVPAFNDPLNSLRQIADLAASSLPDKEAYALLLKLADRFEMFIE